MSPSVRANAIATVLLSVAAVVQVGEARTCPDPFVDPAHDICNPLRYIPSNSLTINALCHFLFVGLAQVWCLRRWGGKWMSALTVGCFTYAIGLALRLGLHWMPQSLGLYITESTFVTLSPCAFIAAEYVLLGRLAIHLKEEKHMLVSPRRITRIFIASDVVTFPIQANGASTAAGADNKLVVDIGSRLFFVGLILQLVSFVAFCYVYLVFLYRVYKHSPNTWQRDAALKKPFSSDWRALALAIAISCIGVLVRSVYRVLELSQGFSGPIATSEGLFYGLDALPLHIAVFVYVPFWPARFIRPVETAAINENPESVDLHERTRE